jgi:hypothetical protein
MITRTESTQSTKLKGAVSLGMICFCGKVRAIETSLLYPLSLIKLNTG